MLFPKGGRRRQKSRIHVHGPASSEEASKRTNKLTGVCAFWLCARVIWFPRRHVHVRVKSEQLYLHVGNPVGRWTVRRFRWLSTFRRAPLLQCLDGIQAPSSTSTEASDETTAVLYSAVLVAGPCRGIRGGISRAISRLSLAMQNQPKRTNSN